jgi:2-amino-4-hydroxy-6-hydroxymethyldihydropteridine diphosphokinase
MTERIVYIGIGSNLGNPLDQINRAGAALAALSRTRLDALAPRYRSRAVGPGDQPDYINTAARLITTLAPETLLDALQAIEADQGRERSIRWGARTLDLDILLFGELTLSTDRLQIPHPELPGRDFVLQPLLDLDPDLTLPNGSRLADLRRNCPDNHLERLD